MSRIILASTYLNCPADKYKSRAYGVVNKNTIYMYLNRSANRKCEILHEYVLNESISICSEYQNGSRRYN